MPLWLGVIHGIMGSPIFENRDNMAMTWQSDLPAGKVNQRLHSPQRKFRLNDFLAVSNLGYVMLIKCQFSDTIRSARYEMINSISPASSAYVSIVPSDLEFTVSISECNICGTCCVLPRSFGNCFFFCLRQKLFEDLDGSLQRVDALLICFAYTGLLISSFSYLLRAIFTGALQS